MKRFFAALCAVLLLLSIPFAAAAEQPSFSAAEEWEVLRLTNAERKKEGAAPVSTFAILHNAAKVRAVECATLFDHTRPNGTSCFTALNEAGVLYFHAGENLAAGHLDPADAVLGWMRSTLGHRENLLDKTHKHLGVGYHTAPGSEYTRYWTQFFISDCSTIALSNSGNLPQFDESGRLLNDPVLTATCDLHGDCYLPLADVSYTYLGNDTYRVTYDGVSAELPCNGYPDVDYSLWYAEGINYVTAQGLMKGMPDGTFAPDKAMTRAEFVTILYRLEQEPGVSGDDGFTDVAPADWFYKQIHWAAKAGLVNGMGDGTFAPNKPVSREEMATILLRFHQRYNPGKPHLADIYAFPDGEAVQAWAKTAMQWAVYDGILSGSLDSATGQTLLLPQGNTTRAQIATVLMRYLSK